jgi:hypothetical protein
MILGRAGILAALAALALLAGPVSSSGTEGYYVPGVDTGDVLMSVHIWGQVANPGTQQVPAGCDLVAALSAAGGPTSKASLDDIRMIVDGIETEYDLDAFLSGEGDSVPQLVPGTTIYVQESHSGWWRDAMTVAYTLLLTVNLVWVMSER